MSKVFRITPKRIKRSNGLVLTPEMSIIVTTRSHASTPFYNGAEEIKEQYMRIYGSEVFRQQYAYVENDYKLYNIGDKKSLKKSEFY